MSPRVVILCAGASSRLGEPKALASIGDRRVLDWMLTAAREAIPDAAAPLVITGCHHREIAAFLEAVAHRPANRLMAEVLFNGRWEAGRTGGLQLAARRLPGEDLLIWPADVPLVGAPCLASLVQEWDQLDAPGRGWLAPSVSSDFQVSSGTTEAGGPRGPRFGHPIILGAGLMEEVCVLGPESPLRQVRDLAQPLATLAVEDRAILDDLDTPADLERLRDRVRTQFG